MNYTNICFAGQIKYKAFAVVMITGSQVCCNVHGTPCNDKIFIVNNHWRRQTLNWVKLGLFRSIEAGNSHIYWYRQSSYSKRIGSVQQSAKANQVFEILKPLFRVDISKISLPFLECFHKFSFTVSNNDGKYFEVFVNEAY